MFGHRFVYLYLYLLFLDMYIDPRFHSSPSGQVDRSRTYPGQAKTDTELGGGRATATSRGSGARTADATVTANAATTGSKDVDITL